MFKKTKRTAVAVSLVTAGALMLGACGSSTGSSAGGITGEISYAFWGSPARADKVNKVIDQFQKAHAGTTVKAEVADYTAYVERLTVRAAGGDLACATGTQSTFLAQYATKDVLLPLDDLIKSGKIDTTNIPKDVMAAGQVNGKQYMIPTGTFVRIIGYNASLVEKAGVAAPTNDMTWEDYSAWLRSLQPKLSSGVYAGENEGGLFFTLTEWVAGHGEKMFTADNKLALSKQTLANYFQYWIDLAKDGAVLPPSSIQEQYAALEQTPIATGKAVSGTRDIPHLYIMQTALAGAGKPSSIKMISIPSESKTQSANVVGSNGISIPKNCTNVDTAAAFINHFANDTDAALAFQSDNGILTNTKAQTALLADANTPAGVKQNVSLLKGLTDSGDLTTSTYPAGLSTLTTELLRLYQAAAFGQIPVQQAVDSFFTSAEKSLK
jgi:multiple sugar transport system substrate-binding protein